MWTPAAGLSVTDLVPNFTIHSQVGLQSSVSTPITTSHRFNDTHKAVGILSSII